MVSFRHRVLSVSICSVATGEGYSDVVLYRLNNCLSPDQKFTLNALYLRGGGASTTVPMTNKIHAQMSKRSEDHTS